MSIKKRGNPGFLGRKKAAYAAVTANKGRYRVNPSNQHR